VGGGHLRGEAEGVFEEGTGFVEFSATTKEFAEIDVGGGVGGAAVDELPEDRFGFVVAVELNENQGTGRDDLRVISCGWGEGIEVLKGEEEVSGLEGLEGGMPVAGVGGIIEVRKRHFCFLMGSV